MKNLCTFDGCTNEVRVKSRGLCSGHNYQWKMGYELYEIGSKYNVTKYCKLESCNEEYSCNGYCLTHYNMKYKTGLDPQMYEDMLVEQNYKCAICGCDAKSLSKRFQIDHDHSCCPTRRACSKCVRGLLCSSCNLGIGNLKDDISILEKATDYLKKFATIV